MTRAALTVTLLFALLAFACAFGGTSALLTVTQPAAPGVTAQVDFTVQSGDSAKSIGDRLQQQGLIRNATLFELLAKVQNLQSQLRAGTYTLSAGMSMGQIIQTLVTAAPDRSVQVTVGPGLRILEYPDLFGDLHNFNKDNFLKIAQTGTYSDGSSVSSKYWFVPALHKDAKFALEGYLYPDTYSFRVSDNEVQVINRLLDNFGEHLCPGPDKDPEGSNEYFHDKASCLKNAATVGTDQKSDIFTVAKAKFFVTDEVEALYKALTLSSIVIRESGKKNNHEDASTIADILYRRYLVSQGKLRPPGAISDYKCMDADPTVWYAYFSDNAPSKGYWDVVGSPNATAKDSPYNTYTHCDGLIPGPISSPYDTFLFAAVDPNLGKITPDFFYLHDACDPGNLHVAVTLTQQQANQAKYVGKCPSGG